MAGLGNDFNTEDPVGITSEEMKKKPFKLHTKEGDVTDVTFVDDFIVEVAVA